MLDTATPLPGFCGGTLDRADHIRTDAEQLARAFAMPDARQVLLKGLDPVDGGGACARAPIEPGSAVEDFALLGLDQGVPQFVRLVENLPRGAGSPAAGLRATTTFSAEELATYGLARSLVSWHAHHRFCAVCGQGTHVTKAGWSRQCSACGAEHFPRVDPVTIMLAEHEGRILLGRQPRFAPRMYSALAGFVEPGETIEQAVARELFEEAGVVALDVRYVISQPWPFPSSLMIGCIARVKSDRLVIDTKELDDAIWVSLEDLRGAMTGSHDPGFLLPSPTAVAWHLVRHWVDHNS